MKIGVSITWKIVVDSQVDTLNIDTTSEDIGGDTDTLIKLLELLITLDALLLADTRVDSDRWEVALAEELVELSGTKSGLDEDDDLVELHLVEELVELAVLLLLIELDVVLLETVKGELGIIIDVDLKWVLHELLANWADLGGEGGGEHHDLLLGWGGTKDLLNIAAHI